MAKSGISIEKKAVSSLHCGALEDEDVQKAVQTFRSMVESCYGPGGKLKMLQNVCGGHVTITSSSSRLLHTLPISNPALKLLAVAVQGHLNTYQDGGLFACCLATSLLGESLKSATHRKLLADVYGHLLNQCLGYLNSSDCACRVPVSFTNLASLRCIVRSVIATKPACDLNDSHINHLTGLIVELFLQSYMAKDDSKCWFAPVSFVTFEGRCPAASRVIKGLLFEVNYLPRNNMLINRYNELLEQNLIKVALVTVSMSGDTTDYADVHYEAADEEVDTNSAAMESLLSLCDIFVKDRVSLVLCQKVIHPRIKKYLHKQGVYAVERLGASYVKLVQELSGAVPINSVHTSHCEYGLLDSLTEYPVENNKYIHLQRDGAGVCSMILYHRTEESLQELKNVCESALTTLRNVLQNACVLTGAGCWQVHLAAFIKHKAKEVALDVLHNLGCTKLQFWEAVHIFSSSLERTAVVLDPNCDHMYDSVSLHHWMIVNTNKMTLTQQISCGCRKNRSLSQTGLKFQYLGEFTCNETADESFHGNIDGLFLENGSAVVDSMSVMLNAMRVSVSTCNMILGISNIVSDEN